MTDKAYRETWQAMADAIRAEGMQSFVLVAVGPDGHVHSGSSFAVHPEAFPAELRAITRTIENHIKREAARAAKTASATKAAS